MKFALHLRSLPVQLVISFIAIVILTAVTAGLPAIWLIGRQLENQAWSQVMQGRSAAQALYAAKKTEVIDLANLTAQRPTLYALLEENDLPALTEYLGTLRSGAGLGAILVCNQSEESLAISGSLNAEEICTSIHADGFYRLNGSGPDQVWLFAQHSLDVGQTNAASVVVGMLLDEAFARQLRSQTGLEHTIWAGEQAIATSLPAGKSELAEISEQSEPDSTPESVHRRIYQVGDSHYYASLAPLDEGNLTFEVSLDVSEIEATQRNLAWILVGSTLSVALLGSILGVFLARRISRPLVRLADTAVDFSKGDLSSSVPIDTHLREVEQVARTLENARVNLQETLTILREEKAWNDHLLDSIVEGIVAIDDQHRISFFSTGAERITGWKREQVLNHPIDQVFLLADMEGPFNQQIPPPGEKRLISVRLAQQQQAILAITGARIAPPEAGEAWVVLVFRDVSGEEAVHRLLGHFLANIAHEFRTPLSSLAASIELLMDQAPDLSEAELQELLTALHLGALGLQNLVDNLLESASIEAGRFRVSPRRSDLGEVIGEAARIMQPLLEKYGQGLTIDLPVAIPQVMADPRRIVQVLVNLLSNASRYGPPEADIQVKVRTDNGWAEIQVLDQGPGIPTDLKGLVFQRFLYPDTLNDSTKVGAGLGLSVVKAIVEAHGGQVGVDDRSGGGSIFWFTLPLTERS